ncbi:hypothetical protein JCM3765_003505 [Sporobolomyces pararoseus]
MFSKLFPLCALILLILTLTCNAERAGPHRLNSLSKRSLSERISNTMKRSSQDNRSLLLVSRDAASQDEPTDEFNRAPFDLSLEKRQTGVSPKEAPGDSNPVPKPQNLNNLGDSAPLSGEANGAMAPFQKRSSTSSESFSNNLKEKRYPHPHPVPEPYQLNEISHLLATRGKADGSIEYS